MSVEASPAQSRPLSIYEAVSLIIDTVDNISGFRDLSIKQQELVLRFVSARMDFLADTNNERKRDVFVEMHGEVHKDEHLRAIAFNASLRIQEDARKKPVKDNNDT